MNTLNTPIKPVTLTKRSDFLRLRNGVIQKRPAFILQASKGLEGQIRVGYTCSKKVGNAVARNRAKRRLREAASLILPTHGRTGWDYVFIGRANVTANRNFEKILNETRSALSDMHKDAE